MNVSEQQRAILGFIEACLERDGRPPTQLEICAAFGFRQNATASYHLRALEQAGLITRTPGLARSIRLARGHARGQREGAVHLPVLGRVAAGLPIGADADYHDERWVDARCFSPRPDFLLRVVGDSMRDDGILDGDLVAVKRSAVADPGQTVVARLDGEITIKRLHVSVDGIRLLPRNPEFAPIVVAEDADFAIEGVFCGLLRSGA